jgi:hypothetical protein
VTLRRRLAGLLTRIPPRADVADGDASARYAPELDGEPDPGEVVWAWVPYEDDPGQGKDRPVLLLDTDGTAGPV